MTTSTLMPKRIHDVRKPNTMYGDVCDFINSKPIGYTYKCKEIRNATGVHSERLAYIQKAIMIAKVINRVARGTYMVMGTIPDFVTYNMLEANMGAVTEIPNPDFIGYNEDGTCINGIRKYVYVPRGFKWKLGEPNPYLAKVDFERQETIKKLKEAEVAQTAKGCLINELVSKVDERHYIIATNVNGVEYIVIGISPIISDRVSCYIKGKDIVLLHINQLSNFQIVLRAEYDKEEYNKREQIINILKQGLSAADAADQILNLIK